MKYFRFSILRLMAAVALIAVACVALPNASDLWFSIIYSADWLLLVASVPNIAYRKGQARAFWFGFVIFGLGYWLWAFRPLTNLDPNTGMQGVLPARLFEWLYTFVAHSVPDTSGFGGGGGGFGGSGAGGGGIGGGGFGGGGFGGQGVQAGGGFFGGGGFVRDPPYHAFLLVGNALSLLLLAILGGYWSRFVYWRGKHDQAASKENV